MTYCVAVATEDGLVFCSDSRTSAGPDMLSSYSKMHVFTPAHDRLFVLLTSGNLATTQAIISRIENELDEPDKPNLRNCKRMVDVAKYVGKLSREEQLDAQTSTTKGGVDTSASLLLGGQIKGGEMGIYMIYPAGNFITDSNENPFLQIGESKYGKPILDRILTRKTSLEDAARCAVVSMDSTLRSNATVGPPIELLVYEDNTFESDHYLRFEEDDDYLRSVRQHWNEALKEAFSGLPPLDWEQRTSHANVLTLPHDTNRQGG
jgi:putative proteasome-type protease